MSSGIVEGDLRIAFPGLTAAEAGAAARELEQEFVASGMPAAALHVVRSNAEAMDLGSTLIVIGGALTWEFLKSTAKGAGSEVGQGAGRDAYGYLRRKLDEFCQRRQIAAEVHVPGQGTWFLRSEYDRSGEQEVRATIPNDIGTLGVILLGASVFRYLEGLDNPAFARSAAAAKEVFATPGPMFRDAAVLDLFDQEYLPHEIVEAIDKHIETHPGMADVLVYYCGHGSFLRDRTYFLTLRNTRPGKEASTGLKLRDLRHDLEARLVDRRLYLVLDCCFAGAAAKEFMGPNVKRVVEQAVREALPPGGWVVLAAASESMPAMAPAGHEQTMFTGALAQVLGRAARPLSFDDIAFETRHYLQAAHGARAVLPECHAPLQRGGDLRRVPLFGGTSALPKDEAKRAAGSTEITDQTPEHTYWLHILHSSDPLDFEAFLDLFPAGTFSRFAMAKAEELITNSEDNAELEKLLVQFPQSPRWHIARERLARLEWASLASTLDQDLLASFASRFPGLPEEVLARRRLLELQRDQTWRTIDGRGQVEALEEFIRSYEQDAADPKSL